MKPRTSFELLDNGTVSCSCGTLIDFAKDLNEFIVPIIGNKIKAQFCQKTIFIYRYDDENAIIKRFTEALRQ